MKRVITYGTFDLFHEGHIKLLERSKKLGDYLIVGVTTDNYDKMRGKLNVKQSLIERIENVKKSGLADEIIVEEYEGQKVEDVQKYNIDIFAIGSDWYGKFDYLNEFCDVIYLERTKGISSTKLRNKNDSILKIGIIGNGRIANRFIPESKYVSGINVEGIFGINEINIKRFADKYELNFYTSDYDVFLNKVDAIYIASPHNTHYEYAKKAIIAKKHVLCEKPITLDLSRTLELVELSKNNNVVLMEAIKTAFCPGFLRLISIAKSGVIGDLTNIEATFTKIENRNGREFNHNVGGGSFNELSSYVILPVIKLLGTNYKDINFISRYDNEKNVDIFTKTNIIYETSIATLNVGLGVKSEGDLKICGTKGYIYVKAPWWKTEEFELKFENFNENKKYSYRFEGDGLRYEIAEFLNNINNNKESYMLSNEDIIAISKIISLYNNQEGIIKIG